MVHRNIATLVPIATSVEVVSLFQALAVSADERKKGVSD